MILCFGHAQTAFGSEITLRVTQQASVYLCETYQSDRINSTSTSLREGTWWTWTWRRLLVIILTLKSLYKASHGFGSHKSQINIYIYILSIVSNYQNSAAIQCTRIEDSAGQKNCIFESLHSIKILRLLLAWCCDKSDRLQNPQFFSLSITEL